MKNNLQITCPQCGHLFSPEAAMESHWRAHLEKEYSEKQAANIKGAEERAKAIAQQEFLAKIDALEKESLQKSQKLLDFERKSIELDLREKGLMQKEELSEIEFQKRLLKEEERIKNEAEAFAFEKISLKFTEKEASLKKQQESLEINIKKEAIFQVEKAREEERMKYAELLKKYDEQKRMAEEMQRKAQQGSMQLQGEVQEIAIEEYLKKAFPKDEIEEIAKGVKGGDCVHIVKDNFGNECGRILYESKRTQSFSKGWIAKLKEDMRMKQADLGVIVTEAMPGDLHRFGQIDGIWICSFSEFKSVSLLLRLSVIRVGEITAAQENKGDKMQLLYEYLTGNEFRQRIESISEAFQQMTADLQKEKAQATSNFAKREKQLFKVLENTMALYGEVRGIAGGAVQSIPLLETDSESPQFLKEAS